ncbi:hypothetical protein CASFOL_027328 [Castilleja foliolosa]|uniref:Uncharacterized protein n=1 Tax=Castilleja foliolosa TaxID=1961234 RepID=A0ABD3CFK0_9LAMI
MFIGQYIASNGGIATAEELAPYLDLETSGKTLINIKALPHGLFDGFATALLVHVPQLLAACFQLLLLLLSWILNNFFFVVVGEVEVPLARSESTALELALLLLAWVGFVFECGGCDCVGVAGSGGYSYKGHEESSCQGYLDCHGRDYISERGWKM